MIHDANMLVFSSQEVSNLKFCANSGNLIAAFSAGVFCTIIDFQPSLADSGSDPQGIGGTRAVDKKYEICNKTDELLSIDVIPYFPERRPTKIYTIRPNDCMSVRGLFGSGFKGTPKYRVYRLADGMRLPPSKYWYDLSVRTSNITRSMTRN